MLKNIGTILIGEALEEQGLPLPAVTLVPIPFPQMVAALKEHKVDALATRAVPERHREQIGAQEVYDLDQGAAAGLPIVGYAVTETWDQKYSKTAAAF